MQQLYQFFYNYISNINEGEATIIALLIATLCGLFSYFFRESRLAHQNSVYNTHLFYVSKREEYSKAFEEIMTFIQNKDRNPLPYSAAIELENDFYSVFDIYKDDWILKRIHVMMLLDHFETVSTSCINGSMSSRYISDLQRFSLIKVFIGCAPWIFYSRLRHENRRAYLSFQILFYELFFARHRFVFYWLFFFQKE